MCQDWGDRRLSFQIVLCTGVIILGDRGKHGYLSPLEGSLTGGFKCMQFRTTGRDQFQLCSVLYLTLGFTFRVHLIAVFLNVPVAECIQRAQIRSCHPTVSRQDAEQVVLR